MTRNGPETGHNLEDAAGKDYELAKTAQINRMATRLIQRGWRLGRLARLDPTLAIGPDYVSYRSHDPLTAPITDEASVMVTHLVKNISGTREWPTYLNDDATMVVRRTSRNDPAESFGIVEADFIRAGHNDKFVNTYHSQTLVPKPLTTSSKRNEVYYHTPIHSTIAVDIAAQTFATLRGKMAVLEQTGRMFQDIEDRCTE